MTAAHQQVLADLDEARQRLSLLLINEKRDFGAIIEAADAVRRLERRVVAIEAGQQ